MMNSISNTFFLTLNKELVVNKELIFHAKLDKNDTRPDHTLIFYKDINGNIILGYSRPRSGTPDVFCKASGLVYASDKLCDALFRISPESVDDYIKSTLDVPTRLLLYHGNDHSISKERKIKTITEKDLNKVLPSKIIKTLSYYAGRAKKYYKIEGDKISLIFKGDRRNNTVFSVDITV